MFQVGQKLTLNQGVYRVAEHPEAPGVPYGQTGRAATVYKLISAEDALAIKIFKSGYRNPALVRLTRQLQPFANIDGLSVCRRYVLTSSHHSNILSQNPNLLYSVVMPWVEGETWLDVILAKKTLDREVALRMVKRFLQILVNLEEQGIAHCDLSGANVMLPVLSHGNSVELVDVEQLYAPELTQPASLAMGTPGYVHPQAPTGGWNTTADRFAGAILLVEMMGWLDAQVRKASWDESYFEQSEMQQDSARYRILLQALQRHWGKKAAGLLEQVWRSNSTGDCPTFGEWHLALNGRIKPDGAAATPRQASADPRPDVRPGRESPKRKPPRPKAVTPPPPPPSLPPQTVAPTRKQYGSTSASRKTFAPHKKQATSVLEEGKRWNPDIPDNSSESKANKYLVAFLGIAALLGLLILVFNGIVHGIVDILWINGGHALYNGIGAGALSFVISLVQAWIFRYRLPNEKRTLFILSTTAAGFLGGFIGGSMIRSGIISWPTTGLVVGVVGGIVASFAQAKLMRNNETKGKWIIWNTTGWIIAWTVGWYAGFIISSNDVVSMAVSAIVIISIIGFSLTRFLKSTPEFEF